MVWISSSFSPDGTMIVTSGSPGVGDPGNADVDVMNVDGSGLVNVTESVRWDSGPTGVRNGTKVGDRFGWPRDVRLVTDMARGLLSLKEVAAYLGVSRERARKVVP